MLKIKIFKIQNIGNQNSIDDISRKVSIDR